MKKNNRMVRINDEIQKEAAQIIRGELQDPRIGSVVSVTRVETTQDLKYCKIYVSALGSTEERQTALDAVRDAGGYIRRLIAERINLRQTPQLTFVADDSIERGMRISKLIDEANKDNSLKREDQP